MRRIKPCWQRVKMVMRFNEVYPDYQVYLTGMVMLDNAFAASSMRDMMKGGSLDVFWESWCDAFSPSLDHRHCWHHLGDCLLIRDADGVHGTYWLSSGTAFSFGAHDHHCACGRGQHPYPGVGVSTTFGKGCSKNDAIVESLGVNFQLVFLTGLTAAIGFLSMTSVMRRLFGLSEMLWR
ncbi:MAG: hypothetical protein M2R45_05325 [Verrucomicrobia subdivision 3 bacterium]|nr:hypothetical protein [Limisphaerales bacterium]MCS1415721.1 hypothetical protein [Limisphaerales bacterium]